MTWGERYENWYLFYRASGEGYWHAQLHAIWPTLRGRRVIWP